MLRFCIPVVFAACLLAQAPPVLPPNPPQGPPPGAMGALKDALSLEDGQVAQFFALQRERAQALRPLHEEMVTRERALGEMLKGGSTDAAAIGKQVLSIESQRKLIRDTEESFKSRALGVLTAAQTTKLEELKQALKLERAAREAIGLQLIAPPQPPPAGPAPGARNWRDAGRPEPW